MSKINLKLNGLDCASCGMKIEDSVKKIKGVKESDVIFAKEEIIINYDEKEIEKSNLLNNIESLVDKIDDRIFVAENLGGIGAEDHGHSHDGHSHGDNAISKQRIIFFGVGVALFIISLFVSIKAYKLPILIGAYILLGGDVVIRAVKNIMRKDFFDENFLMSISTIGAFFIGDYIEAVAVMLFYQIGEFFSDLAVGRSRKSIKELMDIKPEYANVEKDGELIRIDPSEAKIGDIILVKPGERIPLDGIIIEGKSQIDSSALTGESIPVDVAEKDSVLNGAINLSGVLKVRVTEVYANSTVARIMDMVENASAKKAPVEKFITRFSKVYTPIVVFAAVLLGVLPPLLFGYPFAEWIRRSVVFLVISCPCALVISVPLTFFSGIGHSSKKGILVKGGNYLQALSEIDAVVFDKTGTITKGVFGVEEIVANKGISTEEILEIAYAIESYSNHPIAGSIVDYYEKNNGTKKFDVTDYEEVSGHGLKALIDGKEVLAGNDKLMTMFNIKYSHYEGVGTVVYVAKEGKYLGAIVISDKIKDDSIKAVADLKKQGIKNLVMLTGDRKEVGLAVAEKVGIDKVYYELLPDEKVERIEELYKENPKRRLAFVGDGINDAPALARADIGIAMGGVGSAAAMEAADVVLMTDEPSKIAEAVNIAKSTVKIAKQNIVFALGVKIIVLTLGAFGMATMWMAVFADVGVTLLAVLNSMRKK